MCLTVNRCAVGLNGEAEPNLSSAIIIRLHQPDHILQQDSQYLSFYFFSVPYIVIHQPAKGAYLRSR